MEPAKQLLLAALPLVRRPLDLHLDVVRLRLELDRQRRRISLSIKQAAEGGEVAAEYQEAFGEHAYDSDGNYIGGDTASEGQAAWEEYYAEHGDEAAESEAAVEYEYVEVEEEVEVEVSEEE